MHTTNGNLKNLKVIIFPIPLYSTIYSARFSLALSTASMVEWLAWKTLILGTVGSSHSHTDFYVDFILFSIDG